MSGRVYGGEWIVTSLVADRAQRFGDDIALRSIGGDLTYGDIAQRAARIGRYLEEIGIEPGDRVATMLRSTIDYVAAWFGVAWRNAIEVPINTEYRGVFLQHMLRDSGARAIIVDGRWLERLGRVEVPNIEHVIVVGEAAAAVPPGMTAHRFADAVATDPGPLASRGGTDPTYIMYTGGTTGPAKGVVHNNASSFHYIQGWATELGVTAQDVCYSMFPLFHQMGRSACVFAAMWNGIPVILREGFSVSGFWDDIRASGATYMGYFGAVLALLWKQEPSPADTDHGLRLAFGASGPQEIMAAWQERFGVRLHEVYGSTEIGPGSGLVGEPRLGTMGRPTSHIELRIVDDNDDPVPPGVVGEAVFRPRHANAIFQGYWNRPEATVAAWRNLWFHSGDAGYLTDDGYFVFTDRMKDTIRRRGENISSFSVEEAVRAVDRVHDCAAFAVQSDLAAGEEEVMVAVVPGPDGPPDVRQFFETLCDTMPRHAVPRYLRFMDALPTTPTLRIQKVELRTDGITVDTHDREAMGIFPPHD